MTTTSFDQAPHTAKTVGPWKAQLAHPNGVLGWIAGHVMAVTNRSMNQWVVDGLGIRAGELVLEIGAGPGVGLARAASYGALVVGVDHSEEMLRQAKSRNRRAAAEGRVRLVQAGADRLPLASESIDVVFAVDAADHWDDLFDGLCEARRVLREGGRVAMAVSDDAFVPRLVAVMRAVGFQEVTTHDGPSVTCVTGIAATY